jgi:hypothetical protein
MIRCLVVFSSVPMAGGEGQRILTALIHHRKKLEANGCLC